MNEKKLKKTHKTAKMKIKRTEHDKEICLYKRCVCIVNYALWIVFLVIPLTASFHRVTLRLSVHVLLGLLTE